MKKTLPPNALLIPDHAKRVFKGIIFDVYHWPQKMFDGSEETYERIRRPDTVQVIAIKDGKIVMQHENQPHKGKRFGFPGGRAEGAKDKSWLAAAQRELLEETGLQCKNWRLLHVSQPDVKMEWFGAIFLAWDVESEQSDRHESGEDIRIELTDFAAVRQRVLDDKVLGFARPLFLQAKTLDELLALPAYEGTEVDR